MFTLQKKLICFSDIPNDVFTAFFIFLDKAKGKGEIKRGGGKKGRERREEIEGLKRGEGSNRGRWVDEVKGEREEGINKVKEREKKGREREKRG